MGSTAVPAGFPRQAKACPAAYRQRNPRATSLIGMGPPDSTTSSCSGTPASEITMESVTIQLTLRQRAASG